jgi:hypothetical protein
MRKVGDKIDKTSLITFYTMIEYFLLKTGGTFFGFGVDRPRLILD